MSDLSDYQDMRRIDERLLAGEPVPEEPELTALVVAVRSLANAPAPLPTPALLQVLSEGLPVDAPVSLSRHRRSRRSTIVKIAIGAAVAAAAATGAAALEGPEAVREPARSFFSGVADLFTPWESQPQPQPQPEPQPEPQPQPQPGPGGPSDPSGRQPIDEPTRSPDPANRPEDPGNRPETPADPAAPQPSGNPDANPGPPSDPGPQTEPDRSRDTERAPGAAQQPGDNPYPTTGHLR